MKRLIWLLCIFAAGTASLAAQVAIYGDKIYTMAGDPIQDGVILIEAGKITAVGSASEATVPEGFEVHRAAVVTPGLIDARTVIGLTGYLNQSHDQDQLEGAAAMQPELRAIDAYNPRERLVEWVRSFGVTTLHTGHGPGKLISGQTMVVKTAGDSVERAVLRPAVMVAATLGEGAREQQGSPGSRSKMIAMLRQEFLRVQDYARKRDSADEDKKPALDLRKEALARVLDRELSLLVTVHRAHDILSALRLAEEFNLSIVLDGAAESYLVTEEILQAGAPVIVHPAMQRAFGEAENLTFESASRLRQSGISIALQSGFESYVPKTRVVLFEAAVAAAHGLSFDDALAAITIWPARLLGVDDRVGSLKAGKDGDVVLFDGDPFEYLTHVEAVFVDGRKVSDGDREWR